MFGPLGYSFGYIMTDDFVPRCVYLTCKSMQVFGEDFESDPEYQAGMVEFSCTQTFQGQGPDGDEVSLELCSNAERPCFREVIEFEPPPGSSSSE